MHKNHNSLLLNLRLIALYNFHHVQRLLVNTAPDHPDYTLLQEAEKVMHEFARKIGSLSESSTEDGQQETLKKLELLLITDVRT